jgi:hypothetical protein
MLLNPIGFLIYTTKDLEADRDQQHSVLTLFDCLSAILHAEQFRLLGRKLFFSQQPLRFQRAQPFELFDWILGLSRRRRRDLLGRWRIRLRRWSRLGLRRVRGVLVSNRILLGLPTIHRIACGLRRARHDGGGSGGS